MKQIRFDFTCSRQVPFYGYLCNQYLNYRELNITVGEQDCRYFIEAEGEQSDLEALADKIAADFLISLWLVDSKIQLIENREGSNKPLDNADADQAFCQQCFPLFADNQSPLFADINMKCECCQGEVHLSEHAKAQTRNSLKDAAATLLETGELTFNGTALSLTPIEQGGRRDKLLICNPNTLNAHFIVKDHQVFALSSLEKPLIPARPMHSHPKLNAPMYDLSFAYDRELAVICEILRQKGHDFIFFAPGLPRRRVAWVEQAWSETHAPMDTMPSMATVLTDTPEPLHDDAQFAGIHAYWKKGDIKLKLSKEGYSDVERDNAGICALHGGNLESGRNKNVAVLYLSKKFPGQILTLDGKKQSELFFALPVMPDTGYEIYHQLEQSPQRKVLEKYKAEFPEDYMRLLDLKLEGPTDNLQSLWAIAAVLLGLPAKALTKDSLADALLASAMHHKGANAPRVDYPLTKGEAHRSLNWCKTLGTVMSFRLADPSDPHKIAFGMQDSLADFISNWIEHVDQNVGVKSVTLAGSEFSNEILARRISLRLGKNFPLTVNRKLAMDGNNLAAGALYLKQRRR